MCSSRRQPPRFLMQQISPNPWASTGALCCELLPELRHEPACFEDLENVWGKGLEAHDRAAREMNLPAGDVELNDVARFHPSLQPRALDDGESEVDRIPEEAAAERVRKDRGD